MTEEHLIKVKAEVAEINYKLATRVQQIRNLRVKKRELKYISYAQKLRFQKHVLETKAKFDEERITIPIGCTFCRPGAQEGLRRNEGVIF